MAADWRRLVDHVMAVPERIYERWNSVDGWDNDTEFGKEYGENGVSWCVIFDWDMHHAVGLQAVVPKTDNVSYFSDWAQRRGQWSEFPSVGAWVNFGNGQHTEIVVGFDATYVYTKGGNSVQAGASDNGQGNGVWSHRELRRAQRVTGYFAPRFPDGICPPTADPHDPRGGWAVAAWRWPGPAAPTTPQTTTPEDTMPAPVDVWAYKNKAQAAKNPKLPDAYGYLQGTYAAVQTQTAQLAGLTAALAALTAKGGLTAAEITAAAKAGADAALAELGDALTKEH